MFRQYHECEPIPYGWRVVEHRSDVRSRIARCTVRWVPCRRVQIADGVVAHIPTDPQRAWEALIIAERATTIHDGLRIEGLPILASSLAAGQTWCLKVWSQIPQALPIPGCMQ